jgi:hypothetical protein
MYARDYSRKIGAATAKRTVISVKDDDREVGLKWRIMPSANPPYGLRDQLMRAFREK